VRVGIFVVMAGREAGGPETYERCLVRELAALGGDDDLRVFCLDQQARESFAPVTRGGASVSYHVLRPSVRWVSITATLPWRLWRGEIDLLHATFIPPPFSPAQYVFTMHCFSTFAHPEFYPPAIRWRLNGSIKRGLSRARLILCVSENVRDLTAEKFRLPPERLRVIYNGIGDEFLPRAGEEIERAVARREVAEQYGIHDPYLLFVGQLKARKNVVRLIEAFHRFRQEVGVEVKLVLAGRRSFTSEGIDETLERLRLRRSVIELGHLRHEALPTLYRAAEVFVFPSLWEGFGIPVIEAMACHTPVVTSNVSSLPEVAGGCAVLVDPYSVEDLAAGMYRAYTDTKLRVVLRAKGFERAKQFTWRRTARETLAAYREANTMTTP